MRIRTDHLAAPRVFATALGVVLSVAAWLLFAPERLGGSATYVIVHGSSMEPRLHADDLVIVRQAGSARVGDVAAYRSRDLGQPVLHRVVSVAHGRYVFKGDHNGWLDREHPTSRELIGKRWLTVPQGGGVLEWTRAPGHAPLLTVPTAALFVGGFGKRRKRRRPGPVARRPELDLDPALVYGPAGRGLLLGAAIVGALSLFLGLIAFARPTAVAGTQSVAYEQQGRFGYSADSPEGFVYDTGKARTGQPVFLRLSRSVAFAFTYRLRTSRPSFVSGRAGLSAQRHAMRHPVLRELTRDRPPSGSEVYVIPTHSQDFPSPLCRQQPQLEARSHERSLRLERLPEDVYLTLGENPVPP